MGVIFLYKIFTDPKGSYIDHTHLLWTEALNTLRIPFLPHGRNFVRESSGEIECRRVAEKLTGKLFPKTRPNFLKNSVTSANLEIDCYCEELKTGIEYNGEQHYRYIPYFHSSRDAFTNTKYRDDMKKRLCEENNVKLIIVPYTVPVKDIEDYLKDKI